MKIRSSHHHRGSSGSSSTVKYSCCALTVAFFLVTAFVLSLFLPEHNHHHHHRHGDGDGHTTTLQQQQQQQQPQQHRIAVLLPYTAPTSSNAAASLQSVPYLVAFCAGAAGAADIADFFVFHTGCLAAASDDNNGDDNNNNHNNAVVWPLLQSECPPNVIFVNLGSHRGLAERLMRVVDQKYGISHVGGGGGGDAAVHGGAAAAEAVKASEIVDEHDTPKMSRDELLALVTSYIKVNPYGLVEFKPALGHIFQDYLTYNNNNDNNNNFNNYSYTHWGYSDFDILFGDLGRWITLDELTDYDVVTYTFGDQQRLYLRGQFTFHKNLPDTVNQLWRSCDYLTHMDERFERIIRSSPSSSSSEGADQQQQQQRANAYHVESAEGCYSAAVLDRKDVSVKFAVKAWTDIYKEDAAYSHGVFLSRSSSSTSSSRRRRRHGAARTKTTTGRHHVLYKKQQQQQQQQSNNRSDKKKEDSILPAEEPGNLQALSRLQPDWFETEDAVYKDRSIQLQRSVGERERIEHVPDPDANCMYWVLPKYQSKLCLKSHVSSDETVFWINGELFKQRYENAVLQTPGVATAPFFHFQEWKRSYRFGQLASFHLSSPIQTFVLTPEGAIPMIEGKVVDPSREPTVASPLGLSPMKAWIAVKDGDRSQLPPHTYCLQSSSQSSGDGGKNNNNKRVRCDRAVSWHNPQHTTIVTAAPGWTTTVDVEKDVTLVLTLQITAAQAKNQRALQNAVDHLKVSLHRWHGKPSVVVVSVVVSDGGATARDAVTDFLKERLNGNDANTAYLSSSLIAVVHQEESSTKKALAASSRKALMNMAIDAAPTRWYLSGLELERGLSISVDSAFFAHRAAASHSRLRGTVFVVPQFGLLDDADYFDEAGKKLSSLEEAGIVSGSSATDIVISIDDLLVARRKGKIKKLSSFEAPCKDVDITAAIDHLGSVETEWWVETQMLVDPKKRSNGHEVDETARRAASLEELQHGILELATGDHGANMLSALEESPILLTDNLGPHEGIRTSEIAREVETFVGLRCFNLLRLKQLAILGYTFDVLAGAFAASSEASRKAAQTGAVNDGSMTRCQACSIFGNDENGILSKIAATEITRVAKTAIMWAESLGLKQ